MQKVSGFDATWFYIESREMPCHIGAVQIFKEPETGTFHDRFLALLKDRFHISPPYSWRLQQMPLLLDHPVWLEHQAVDLEEHVYRHRLPAPGTRAQLDALCARIQAQPLDRSRPLAEYHVIEGIEGGLTALHSKLHHSYIDGAQGRALTLALYDLTPEPRHVPAPASQPAADPDLGALGLLSSMAGNMLKAPFTIAANALGAAEAAGTFVRRFARWKPELPVLPFSAPRTRFNANVGTRRSFTHFSLPFDQAKRIKAAAGVSLNDVVLGLCAGALDAYLRERGETADKSLVALAPVSLRKDGDAAWENRVAAMLATLATDIPDRATRLKAISVSAKRGKAAAEALQAGLPRDYALPGAPLAIAAAVRAFGGLHVAELAPPSFNVVISNVPNAPVPLYVNGCQMVGNYPISIVAHGAALNITVQSYNGQLDFGITACRKALPDPERLAALMRAEMWLLTEAVLGTPAEPAAADAATPRRAPRRPARTRIAPAPDAPGSDLPLAAE